MWSLEFAVNNLIKIHQRAIINPIKITLSFLNVFSTQSVSVIFFFIDSQLFIVSVPSYL